MKPLLKKVKQSIQALAATSRQTTLLAMSIGRGLGSFGQSFLSKQLLSKLRLSKGDIGHPHSIRSMEYALEQQALMSGDAPPLETTQFKMLIAEQAALRAQIVANTNTSLAKPASWEAKMHQEDITTKFASR